MKEEYINIDVNEYDYPLSDERIAKYPLKNRNNSKLLVYKNKDVYNLIFTSIKELLFPGDLLVFNNTKVVQARLQFTKHTGAKIEIFLLNPVNPSDYNSAFSSTTETQWNCLVGNIKRWKDEVLELPVNESNTVLLAKKTERTPDGALISFSWDNNEINFAQIIDRCGKVPIPPYLNREPVNEDKSRYQTVYAKPEGSVAAPTAGLHFTDSMFTQLRNKGVNFGELTLHVGAGTFRPVKSETIGGHEMHTERIYVDRILLTQLLNASKKVVAVGTTSMRTLESLYWLGIKLIENPEINELHVDQWDGYILNGKYPLNDVLVAILKYMDANKLDVLAASTRMIIVPGYNFKVVNTLVTNFHQPRSTLLLLVAAFIGDDWKRVYNHALSNNFRFLSYGDSSILFRAN
ncbi:MAG: S-adenosylmethionine:tRNA ribosyltransferase-isomerase [Bacteroidales bacterium]